MTRTLAALLLACFAFAQAFAADCPLAAPAAGAQAHAFASADVHGSMRMDAHASADAHHAHGPHDAPEHHHAAECVLAMSCGVAALPHSAVESTVPQQPAADAPWPATSAYLSPALGSDPPPPRLA
jgi:hypothetical protein